ncbi:CAF1-domain-containing protein [Hypoxylon sp. NC0597]|nr:CAF1-domain-containing protein [Hypoxylon sp. NC0597]
MEVNRGNFFWILPSMLDEAQKARFVAIDIEMSGISSSRGRAYHDNSVQDSYTRIKEAVEGYQVLQVGFTFILYDEKKSEYTIRTFNCPVSPLFPRSPFSASLARHLDRKIGISAISYGFLRQHNFDLNYTLDNGIPYLSRREQELLVQFCLSEDIEHEHIDPLALDDESQEFYGYASRQIGEFVATPSKTKMRTFIKSPYGDKLNGLQARLIHQIIREEYPTCIAKRIQVGGMAGCMSVTISTRVTEVETKSRQLLNMDEAKKLSGLQILFEALSGGSFAARINREWITHNNRLPVVADPRKKFNETFDFQQCEANLKRNQPILIGHNLFHDLAFIYNTFFEPLPPLADDFLRRINVLFPRIVDTKFMHTRGKHMMEPDRTLQELHDRYAKFKFPVVRDVARPGLAAPHNAGYDSCMTAVLFLKQTRSLFAQGKYMDAVEEKYYAPTRHDDPQEAKEETTQESSSVASCSEVTTTSLLDQEEAETLGALQNWRVLAADESTSRHATLPTRDADLVPPAEQGAQKESAQKGKDVIHSEIYSVRELHVIPPWGDEFWRAYGNKSSVAGAGCVSFA